MRMMRDAMMTSIKQHIITSAVCLAAVIAAANNAQAQVTTVVYYSFNIPIAKVVPNPCTTNGFTLVSGTMSVAITALQQTAFQLSASVTSTGSGKDVTVDGLPLIVGAGPDYAYSSDAGALSTFPGGVPTYFEHTLRVTDWFVRSSPVLTGDSYVVRTYFRFKYNNGVPSAPVIETISVACE